MTDNVKPENFDWVGARSKCSMRQMFEELRLQIKQDVDAVNANNKSNPPRTFKVAESKKTIKVFEEDQYSLDSGTSVLFSILPNLIRVSDGETNQPMFDITVGLNDFGDCKFVVNGKERDSWQVRREALERVLFQA